MQFHGQQFPPRSARQPNRLVKIKSGAATIKNSSQLAGSGAVETSGMLRLTVFQGWCWWVSFSLSLRLSRRACRRADRPGSCASAPSTAGCALSASPSWSRGSPERGGTGRGWLHSPGRRGRTCRPGNPLDLFAAKQKTVSVWWEEDGGGVQPRPLHIRDFAPCPEPQPWRANIVSRMLRWMTFLYLGKTDNKSSAQFLACVRKMGSINRCRFCQGY